MRECLERVIFRRMMNAKTVEEREENREVLLTFNVEDILYIGLTEFQLGGNEERLVFTASLIQEKGGELVETLRDLVSMFESKEDKLIAENYKLKQQLAEATNPDEGGE